MNFSITRVWAYAAAAAALVVSAGAAADEIQPEQAENQNQPRYEYSPYVTREYALEYLENMSVNSDLALTGIKPDSHLYFALGKDEIIRDAKLHLEFTPSPSLIPVRSQLNIFLNGSLQQSITIEKEHLGRKSSVDIELEPLLIKDYNDLRFNFIGHYTDYCETMTNTTLWLNVSKDSTLKLKYQKLLVANDLTFLPVPFINTATKKDTVLPMVFAGVPGASEIKAAGIIASWGGFVADWRGIDFPVYFDTLPPSGNAVAFATNSKRPYFLADYPEIKAPTIEIRDIPNSVNGKLLIIAAPSEAELTIAAQALVLGNGIMKGPKSVITQFTEQDRREAYDVPKWINTDKETTLGSLKLYEDQLSSNGIAPNPINIGMNLPPDLYFVEGSRISMDLRYNYSQPSPFGHSKMQFLFNNHIVRSYPVDYGTTQKHIIENLPLIGFIDIFNRSNVDVLYLKPKNLLTFDFKYSQIFASDKDKCLTDAVPDINKVEIDPSSKFDFTGTYHFTKMPNLGYFWQAGYPFSIYADLGNTAAIVDNASSSSELNTLFNALGRIGSQTGFPTTKLEVLVKPGEAELAKVADKDLLIIGNLPQTKEFSQKNINLVLNETSQTFNLPNNFFGIDYNGRERYLPTGSVQQLSSRGLGGVVSFESPLKKGRTAVALVADSDEGYENLCRHLTVNRTADDVLGTVSIIKNDIANNLDIGDTYYVGYLPWYERIWYPLLKNPWLLMLCCLLASVVFCYLAFRFLNKLRAKRLAAGKQKDAQAATSPAASAGSAKSDQGNNGKDAQS